MVMSSAHSLSRHLNGYIPYRRFTVAEWLTHSPATLDVTGSRPNSGDFSEI